MAMFFCNGCGGFLDGDEVECFEDTKSPGLICFDCHNEREEDENE